MLKEDSASGNTPLSQGLVSSVEEASGSAKPRKKPPYRTPLWYDKFFEIIQARKLDRVTLEFLKMNVASGKDEYKVYSGLKFLGLINEDGSVTDRLEGLRLTGERFSSNMEQVIRDAYKEILDSVLLESAKPENLINFFIEKYQFSRSSAEGALEMLLYFASKARIPVSGELTSFAGGSKPAEPRYVQKAKNVGRVVRDEPREQAQERVLAAASPRNIQANITMTLDKDTPLEIWDRVLRLLKAGEREDGEE
jgi:hypothetical protein